MDYLFRQDHGKHPTRDVTIHDFWLLDGSPGRSSYLKSRAALESNNRQSRKKLDTRFTSFLSVSAISEYLVNVQVHLEDIETLDKTSSTMIQQKF